jgi:hypothetical protein
MATPPSDVQGLAAQILREFDMTVDVRYLRMHDAKLSPDALYLVTESRKLREIKRRCYTLTGAVRQVYSETVGCPHEHLKAALAHMGG